MSNVDGNNILSAAAPKTPIAWCPNPIFKMICVWGGSCFLFVRCEVCIIMITSNWGKKRGEEWGKASERDKAVVNRVRSSGGTLYNS
jgi:hypothetical protein